MIIPVTPVAKPRMTRSDKWKTRDCVLRYRAYKDQLRPFNITLPDSCKITFHVPMPESWSKKKREAFDGLPHKNKPDIDNLAKGLFDALFEDDAHIWSVWMEKRWAQTGGIEITTLPLDASEGFKNAI